MSDKNDDVIIDREPIHTWFGLTYAQYLTIPRSVLQSMPVEWQERFVSCLNELDETIDWRPQHRTQYRVSLHELKEEWDEWLGWHDAWGNEILDPFMDYERGRRKVPYKDNQTG